MTTNPIFLYDSGDVLVFSSIESAERYIESIDVAKGVYVGFDSEGRILRLTAIDRYRVSICSGEANPEHVDELRQILIDYLKQTEVSMRWLSKASLKELVSIMTKYEIT